MKKNYTNPALRIVLIEDADIVTESALSVGEDVENVSAGSKQRNTIWDED